MNEQTAIDPLLRTGRRRSKEIDLLCTERPCRGCLQMFVPTRSQVYQFRKGKQTLDFCSISCVQRGNIKHLGRPQSGQCAKQEQHVMAKFYCVKSPGNVTYKFRNLENFVRTHAHLFPKLQSATPIRKGVLSLHSSNAVKGLRKLFSLSPLTQVESYLGWVGIWKKDRLGRVVWERAE